jgi:enamine deaminase RidA (YjgF/YER057c/UK114 family)
MAIIEFPGEPSRNGYSHVVVVPPGSRLIYTAGQVPIADDGSTPEGWEAQTRLVFQNLESVLAVAGASWSDVVKLTWFMTGLEELDTVRRVRNEFVDTTRPPASSLVEVAALFQPGLLLEIEAIAAVGE